MKDILVEIEGNADKQRAIELTRIAAAEIERLRTDKALLRKVCEMAAKEPKRNFFGPIADMGTVEAARYALEATR